MNSLFFTGPANVSGPSFPWLHKKKKRRALRVKHPLNKPVESHNQHARAPVPEKPATNVFDRLSTHSTISASKKMHPHPSVEKANQTAKLHATLPQNHSSHAAEATVTHEDEQYQLDQDTPAEPVADRIARIEKELASNSNTPFKRSTSTEESSLQPSKIQKIINAQFSSLSSSLAFKHEAPKSRPAIAAKTNTILNPTTKHPTQVSPPASIRASQPAPQQRPLATNRRSLYNELQTQRTALLLQDEKTMSSAPVLSSELSSPSLPQSNASRPSVTSRRSLYHELQSQNNGSSQQKSNTPSTTPLPSPQSQAPRLPSIVSQSQMQPLAHLPSQPPSSSPQPQPQSQDDVPMKEAKATQVDDDTSTPDFFEDLLKAKRNKLKAPLYNTTKASVSTNDFFNTLLNSRQEKYKNYHAPSTVLLEEQKNSNESTASYFDNLLENGGKPHTMKPSQQQQNKENAGASRGNLSTLFNSSQERYDHHSLQNDSQKKENGDEPLRASSTDTAQSKQHMYYKSPSLTPHKVIATDQHKETTLEPVPSTAVPSHLNQIHTKVNKQRNTLQEDKYFIDERIAKARKALRESKERTKKWLEELSPNQPMKH